MRAGEDGAPLAQATREFVAARSQLFGVAYRIPGSTAEAEDVRQTYGYGVGGSIPVVPTGMLEVPQVRGSRLEGPSRMSGNGLEAHLSRTPITPSGHPVGVNFC
jgi:hypothetical protein